MVTNWTFREYLYSYSRERFAPNAYNLQLTQELKPTDHAQQRDFVEWIMEQHQVSADFSNKIIFSIAAHFHLDGFVNRPDCCTLSSENPRERELRNKLKI